MRNGAFVATMYAPRLRAPRRPGAGAGAAPPAPPAPVRGQRLHPARVLGGVDRAEIERHAGRQHIVDPDPVTAGDRWLGRRGRDARRRTDAHRVEPGIATPQLEDDSVEGMGLEAEHPRRDLD